MYDGGIDSMSETQLGCLLNKIATIFSMSKFVTRCDGKRETPKPSAKDSCAPGARHKPYPYDLRTFHQGLRVAGSTDVP